jgi:NAD(P)-dependent dehydrogenase (short-subunit alcohol dehydrogenase family)
MGRLDGKAALITGAGSGIGEATAELFADEGAAVSVVDVRAEAAEEVAEGIRRRGGEVLGLGGDVSDPADVERSVGETRPGSWPSGTSPPTARARARS